MAFENWKEHIDRIERCPCCIKDLVVPKEGGLIAAFFGHVCGEPNSDLLKERARIKERLAHDSGSDSGLRGHQHDDTHRPEPTWRQISGCDN